MSISRKRKRLLSQLNALKGFGNAATVRKLRKELKERLQDLENKPDIPHERFRISSKRQSYLSTEKSSKLKKYHHYIRMIHDNYPEIPYPGIRKMFKLRKAGKDVSIPDVVWQNPSP